MSIAAAYRPVHGGYPGRRLQLRVVTVPVLDTGIGQAMGYESDAAFMAAARRAREQLPEEVQRVLDREEQLQMDRVLYGMTFVTPDGERVDPRDVQPHPGAQRSAR